MSHPTARPGQHTPMPRLVALAFGLVAVLVVIVLAFSWPSVTAEPRGVPIAITGPSPAVAAVEGMIGQAQPGAIELRRFDDRSAVISAIQARDVYAAIVLGDEPELLTASAASPIVTQLVNALGTGLQHGLQAQATAKSAAQGQPAPVVTLKVTDIVPLSAEDPRGTGFTAAMFPLLLGGMIGGIGISIVAIGAARRALAVAVYAIGGGLVLTAVLQSWFGSLQGNWGLNAAAISLTIAAIAAPITGLAALIGRAGLAAGPALFMLIGNPISGATLPPQFLPEPWGAVGQWFPPGASATLLRDLSYFPSADALFPWLMLAAWAVVGLLLSVMGRLRTAGGAEQDAGAAV